MLISKRARLKYGHKVIKKSSAEAENDSTSLISINEAERN